MDDLIKAVEILNNGKHSNKDSIYWYNGYFFDSEGNIIDG